MILIVVQVRFGAVYSASSSLMIMMNFSCDQCYYNGMEEPQEQVKGVHAPTVELEYISNEILKYFCFLRLYQLLSKNQSTIDDNSLAGDVLAPVDLVISFNPLTF